jgi:hypothetical protein
MTIYETIENMQQDFVLNQETLREDYLKAESEMIKTFGEFIEGEFVDCNVHGTGEVIKTSGTIFEDAIIDVEFEECIKRFSLNHVIVNAKFIKFKNSVITDAYNKMFKVHTELTKSFRELMEVARRAKIEADKKAEAEKKAEIKYQKQKENIIKSFEDMQNRTVDTSVQTNDFYFALGWLAKHIGTISATMPDYLSDSFKKQFGNDASHTVVDSKKRTTNGNSMQWTFAFKATLRKIENIPSSLFQYISSTGKAIADTAFIWDLVDNYGFKFGKKQDVEKIKNMIPSHCIPSFEAGFEI